MASDVEVVDGEVAYEIVPWTGEALPQVKDMSTDQIADMLDQARAFERGPLGDFKQALTDEALVRLDRQAKWTAHLENGLTLSSRSPDQVEYDVPALMVALEHLVESDLISRDAADSAIREKVTYEPAAAVVKALKKLGGQVTDAVEACERPSSKPRSVRVTGGAR